MANFKERKEKNVKGVPRRRQRTNTWSGENEDKTKCTV